jgi:phosphoenolpyruvate carboxykinase (GTP)
MRVLTWIVDRCRGRAGAAQSVLGWMPRKQDLEWSGLDAMAQARFEDLMTVERDAWLQEVQQHDELFLKLQDKLPKELALRRNSLLASLRHSPERWTVS